MKRTTVIAAVVAFGLGGLVGTLAFFGLPLPDRGGAATPPSHPVWAEVQWPFPIDEWGKGKAFRCTAADCGAEINLYIRAKLGFCNCTTGVSDDDELNRLSDFNLIGDKFSVLGPGHPITVAWMKGRSRPYAVVGPFRAGQSALTVAFNDHCDAIVATVVVSHERPTVIEPTIIEFLNSKTILGWAEVTLGL
ncbi:MAG TPA: hypothetical protein VGQ63_09305 [Pseudolabrys sp.]|jgi:hypothetical protein|nr:hypothetical protein [Pseudolabrys sp.]